MKYRINRPSGYYDVIEAEDWVIYGGAMVFVNGPEEIVRAYAPNAWITVEPHQE